MKSISIPLDRPYFSLKVAMLPLMKEDNSTHFNSDSLIRILLRVPPLSEALTELLLEKLPVVSGKARSLV